MRKEEINEKLEQCRDEERELRFTQFGIKEALELGQILSDMAAEKRVPVALDIDLAGFQVFHVCMEGAAPYNNLWIERKKRMVYVKNISSLHAGYLLAYEGKELEKDWLLNPMEYAVKGGGFPILLQNGSCIGCISCSGLPHEQDHRMITEGIRCFLNNENK